MANPVLNDKKFSVAAGSQGWSMTPSGAAVGAPPEGRTLTIRGVASASAVLWVLLLLSAGFGWSQVTFPTTETIGGQVPDPIIPGWMWLSVIGGLILGLVTSFVPRLAPITAPLYALCYGAAIGMISALYNAQFEGIVIQAVLGTVATFGVMLFLFVTRIIKVTQKFAMIIVGATFGILFMYLGLFIWSIFSPGATSVLYEPSPLSIGISVVICAVAALNLLLDFAFIERAVAAGAPKNMEWYAAFGITVTLVWLYLEILRLLSLLRQ